LYPNPVTSTLTIQTALTIQGVTVTDLTGKTVLTGKTANLDLSGLTKGGYLIQIATDKGLITKQIVKK
jgi:hypothetical protein